MHSAVRYIAIALSTKMTRKFLATCFLLLATQRRTTSSHHEVHPLRREKMISARRLSSAGEKNEEEAKKIKVTLVLYNDENQVSQRSLKPALYTQSIKPPFKIHI